MVTLLIDEFSNLLVDLFTMFLTQLRTVFMVPRELVAHLIHPFLHLFFHFLL